MAKSDSKTLKGFRDFLPEEEALRQRMIETIRTVFEQYGFLPMATPALERKEVLTGKYGEDEKLIYSFEDWGKRAVAMRYDLTVPLARFIAEYQNDLTFPFKRYQIAPVWRADKPQKGRYREFVQCDIDIVGTDALTADAEVVACFNDVLKELGITKTVIRINNRKLLSKLIKSAGISAVGADSTIRILDKLDKIGEQKVRVELKKNNINQSGIDSLFGLLSKDLTEIAEAAELIELKNLLDQLGVDNYKIDLSLARGLDYYTGMIMEFVLADAPEFGSILGGGRYDNLLSIFSGKSLPAVGASIGLDRLIAAVNELKLISKTALSGVLVCNLDQDLTDRYLKITRELRAADLKVDFYYEPAKLEKQLKFADKKQLKFAILLGSEEAKANTVQVKNLETGSQEAVPQGELKDFLLKQTKT